MTSLYGNFNLIPRFLSLPLENDNLYHVQRFCLQGVFTRLAISSANLLQKKKFHIADPKKVKLPQDWFGAPTWSLIYCVLEYQ